MFECKQYNTFLDYNLNFFLMFIIISLSKTQLFEGCDASQDMETFDDLLSVLKLKSEIPEVISFFSGLHYKSSRNLDILFCYGFPCFITPNLTQNNRYGSLPLIDLSWSPFLRLVLRILPFLA